VTNWQQVLDAVKHRVVYKSICAGCGKQRHTPVFTSGPQFCNRACHDAWGNLHERDLDPSK
jgi:hypothetical protein